ncbi:MAG: protein adenylyltransferase SelO [Thermodesulfobacteriota bacterium]
MNKITQLTFNNTYRRLPEEFYHIVNPKPFENPFLVAFNPEMAAEIGLDPDEAKKPSIADYLSGKKLIPGSEPIALYYTGHQFGVYNPHIGDGRAILLGEVLNSSGVKWDLHLKGAGRTDYSRQFDGRAVLRSTIREFLCSEAMHYLGIPTTRALCIIGSDEKVERETTETGAMLIRMANSHVRFGSFEGFYFGGQYNNLELLADYVIENSYPELTDKEDKFKLLISEVAKRTGHLIAMWQCFGFTHGVMNTDNMSIIGDTLDYGPYGFMEKFERDYVPNHSDHFGRYSFKNQPSIAYWNLNKLFQCLSTIVDNDGILEALECYKNTYSDEYLELMAKKFGFSGFRDGDKKFIENTLDKLEENKVDYTQFFRKLSDFKMSEESENIDIRPMGKEWNLQYIDRLKKENSVDTKRKERMNRINPKYILRNYIAEKAIRSTVQDAEYSEIEKVRKLLMNPYDEQKGMEDYVNMPPEWAKELIISCSS